MNAIRISFKKLKKSCMQALLVSFALILVASLTWAAEPAWKTMAYKFTMTPATSSQFLWAAYSMSLIQNDTGLKITVLESAGTEENIFRIQNRMADFGQYDVPLLKKHFDNKYEIRQIFAFAPSVWQFAVAKDANIKTMKDLEGKKWNPGPAGGGSTNISKQIVEMLGIKPILYEGTLRDAADAYADRQIVGVSYRGTGGEPTGAFVEMHASRPVTFINMTDEELAKIHAKFDFINKFVIQPGVYPDQPDPIITFASWTNPIGAHKDMPAEAVYEVVKSYWKNHKTIVKQFPGVKSASPESSVEQSLIPLHVGAIKYYKEIGLKIPDKLIPPEAK